MNNQQEQEPPITFQHVIGEQQIEIYMLKRELANLQQQLRMYQEAASAPEENEVVSNRAARRAKGKKGNLAPVSVKTNNNGTEEDDAQE